MTETRCLEVTGQVQGVGFRPFTYRLASELRLMGTVRNQSACVRIEIQGSVEQLEQFEERLVKEAPGKIETLHSTLLAKSFQEDFRIESSQASAGLASVLLPDRSICAACQAEFDDPSNRRFRYPFIACTQCGPRYSVCIGLPFDRAHTTWRHFPPCEHCLVEFSDPEDRRFHCEGISCPQCGPSLYTESGLSGDTAVREVAERLRQGAIVAAKGSSGFHLLVDATNEEAVARLRVRKRRHKPLALLAPDLLWVESHATCSAAEREALSSAIGPIVLLASRSALSSHLAPGLDLLGVMLPYNGIQLALLREFDGALVATSGNHGEAPLLVDNQEALHELARIADCFLLHDLELTQGLDDSVLRIVADKPVALRRGRGLAPHWQSLQAHWSSREKRSLLGCGAHLKSTIALRQGNTIVTGPHVGDLADARTRLRYRAHKKQLPELLQLSGASEITDLHPDYGSSIEADYRAESVPHHVAHAMAAWLEHQPEPPFLALTWDGVGLGPDGTVWGGECLQFHRDFSWTRIASLRRFTLPPGQDIARYPGRIAEVLRGAESTGGVVCSAMGRLIEGLAALAGLRQSNQYEAQAAMEWEALAWRASSALQMGFVRAGSDLDWRPLLAPLAANQIPLEVRARGFHLALARAALSQCNSGQGRSVLLAGGVFQNRFLVEEILRQAAGGARSILPPRQVPPNDGGIATGQCTAIAMGVRESGRPHSAVGGTQIACV